jgi:L-2-hydroxycarboxylate dehydrogenase (NAD+)
MIVQCLGLLGGGAIIPHGVADFGYFVLAIDPSLFMPIEDYKMRASELVERVRAVRPRTGVNKVRVPGERSFHERVHRLAEGFDIDDALYAELFKLS